MSVAQEKGKSLLSFPNDFADTMRLSRKFNTQLVTHKLADLTVYYGIKNDNAHRAVSDCFATHRIFQEMKKRFGS